MFRKSVVLLLLACLAAPAAGQAMTVGAHAVVPFPIYSTDPDSPPGPTDLYATSDALGSWTVTWHAPVDENGDPVAVDNYTVYWLDGTGFWQERMVDDAYQEAVIGTIQGAATVTVIANLDDEPSAAWEYLTLAQPGVGPIFPCPVVRAYLYPPPPGALLYPHCIPI